MQMNKVKIYSNKIPDDVLEMAQYTYEHVPLYADLAAKASKSCLDFEMLPIVGKDIYMSAEGMYLSDEYTDKAEKGKLLQGKTSGSTGKITDFFWDEKEEKKSLLELWYYRHRYYNITPKDKMAYFFPITQEIQDVIQTDRILGLTKAFLYKDQMLKAYLHLMEFRPKWMILQPSVAWLLCKLIQSHHLPKIDSIEYIEFTGEYLENNIRKFAEEVFGCQTANQYGIREVNSIAYECPMGHMHIMRKNAYVEILNRKNGIGDICITSLKNRAMPYIRYMTGDKGKISDKKCTCGNPNPILTVYNGRDNDWIRKSDGSVLHPFALLQVISEVNLITGDCIVQYQLIQKKRDYFIFCMVLKDDSKRKEIEQMICQFTARRLKQEFSVRFHYSDQIMPDVKTGKIAVFICDMTEEEKSDI